MSGAALGDAVMRRLDELAAFTDVPGELTRLYLSPAHKAAALQVQVWMEQAGMSARIDAMGNVVGRYEGSRPGLPALLLGSHIDTVRNAGKYDGNLGVVAAIEAVAALNRDGARLPFAIEVLAFGDEEGVRFPTTLTGSRGVAGTLGEQPGALDASDSDGTSVREALVRFGCNPVDIPGEARRGEAVVGFVEVHIEQGPVLEAEGQPIGVVTAIAGASRFRFVVAGEAGHAGTVPMRLRKDALAAAAEMVLAVERTGTGEADLVATVGQLEILPGAVNVIPALARFTLDIRSPSDGSRERAIASLLAELSEIAARREVTLTETRFYDEPAAICDAGLSEALAAAVRRCGIEPRHLPSGAGHDGLAMVALCPIAMLFVRCRGGVSHNPAESITARDADVAVRVLVDFLRSYRPSPR
jgi:allantoate deiminase